MKKFIVVWFGQAASLVGSSLTGFALGVSVFQNSGSISAFAFIGLFTVLPRVLLSPISGVLVDRWDRRRAIILSDAGAGVCTLALAALLLLGELQVWHIYLLTGISSAFGSIQWPAYMASISMLVPKDKLGKANGMVQLAFAFGEILAPPVAAFLLSRVDLSGVILIDCATFIFAIGTLLCIRFPQSKADVSFTQRERFVSSLQLGIRFILNRRGLSALLGFASVSRFFWGMVAALITPMILFLASAEELGLILGIAGAGMLVGSVVMSIWGGTVPRIRGILCFEAISGVAFILLGIQPSIMVIALSVFLAHVTIAVIEGSTQSIWQAKVPQAIQGRVFSVQQMLVSGAAPVAYLLAGPLAESVFEPLFMSNGALAHSVGKIVGTGPGRGIGMIFIVMGFLKISMALLMRANRQVRDVEKNLPDEGHA